MIKKLFKCFFGIALVFLCATGVSATNLTEEERTETNMPNVINYSCNQSI